MTLRYAPCLAAAAMAWCLGGFTPAVAEGPVFMEVASESMDGEAFVFPQDLRSEPYAIVGLAIGTGRANGEAQQAQLLEWQRWLDEAALLPPGVRVYHVPVIESPPRFIRGTIRRATRRTFEGLVPLDQAVLLFVDSSPAFAAAAGIEIDGEPTLVVIDRERRPLAQIKGGPSEENTTALRAALAALQDAAP